MTQSRAARAHDAGSRAASPGTATRVPSERDRWIISDPRVAGAPRRLLCLPYAGGGASIYRGWQERLGDGIEVCAVQLPGRESRLVEEPIASIERVVERLVEVIAEQLDRPLFVFGHSMGARIGFELARALRARHARGPQMLLVSGCAAPHLVLRTQRVHTLPDHELLEEIADMGGTPRDILANQDLMELYLPALRADFTVDEVYTFEPGEPLACPIHAFGGLQDQTVNLHELEAWKRHTTAGLELHTFQGGHFFPSERSAELLGLLRRILGLA
jgi:surfactin synthase thioesterase subunit